MSGKVSLLRKTLQRALLEAAQGGVGGAAGSYVVGKQTGADEDTARRMALAGALNGAAISAVGGTAAAHFGNRKVMRRLAELEAREARRAPQTASGRTRERLQERRTGNAAPVSSVRRRRKA